MNNVTKIFNELKRKYLISKNIYIFLNSITLILVALLVIFNLFAIRFNPEKNPKTGLVVGSKTILWLFVSMSILSAFGGFVSSLLSFFIYGQRAKNANTKIKAIKVELDQYQKQKGQYKKDNRDRNLINKIVEIRNN